jgi:hypothetical protein
MSILVIYHSSLARQVGQADAQTQHQHDTREVNHEVGVLAAAEMLPAHDSERRDKESRCSQRERENLGLKLKEVNEASPRSAQGNEGRQRGSFEFSSSSP